MKIHLNLWKGWIGLEKLPVHPHTCLSRLHIFNYFLHHKVPFNVFVGLPPKVTSFYHPKKYLDSMRRNEVVHLKLYSSNHLKTE